MLWDFQWVYKTKRQCQNYDALTFKCKTEYKLLVLLFYHHHHHHYSTGKERAALYLFTEKLCCCCTCLWKTLSCLSWDLCCDIQVIWILSVATSNGLGLNVETFLPTWSRSNISTHKVCVSELSFHSQSRGTSVACNTWILLWICGEVWWSLKH